MRAVTFEPSPDLLRTAGKLVRVADMRLVAGDLNGACEAAGVAYDRTVATGRVDAIAAAGLLLGAVREMRADPTAEGVLGAYVEAYAWALIVLSESL